MPDLAKFQSDSERNWSKFKETRQNAWYLFERTVSLRWCGWARPSNDRREVASKWVVFEKWHKNCVQKLKKKIFERSDYGRFCVHNRRSRRQINCASSIRLGNCVCVLRDSPRKLHLTRETCQLQGESLKLQLEIVEPRYRNQLNT